jgi:hypothetical protein
LPASIVNQRLVVPRAGKPYVMVNEHFLYELMLPRLDRIRVDEPWYLATYPDVLVAVKAGTVTGAKMHYSRFGYYEHRLPHQVMVREQWYMSEYPDVKEAVAAQRFRSGQEHFELLGYREGRFPYPDFRLDFET